MTIKNKTWLWYLTFPFAHNNVTTLNGVIYKPKRLTLTPKMIEHEKIHLAQQKEVGCFKFLFLYLFALPFFWNPWRFRWEMEAYEYGTKLSYLQSLNIVKSFRYGWLRNG